MAQTPHEINKNATRVSPLPCLVMIILSPLLLVYLVLSLLFVPVDFLIFKLSSHHRDFGGRYSFLGGAHPDNELYAFIKKRGLKINYRTVVRDKGLVGYFYSGKTLVDAGKNLFWDSDARSWKLHSDTPTPSGEPSSLTLDEWSALRCAQFKLALGADCTRTVFLLKEKTAMRAGADAKAAAFADSRILVYTKGTLAALLSNIESGNDD